MWPYVVKGRAQLHFGLKGALKKGIVKPGQDGATHVLMPTTELPVGCNSQTKTQAFPCACTSMRH